MVASSLAWGDLYRNQHGVLTKYFPLHRGQAAILQSNARYIGALAGTGGGKTTAGALWLAQEIRRKPKGVFLVVTPTFKILNSATLDRLKDTFRDTELQGEHKVGDYEYHCPSGAKIFFRSADSDGSFEGIQADAVWLDEGSLISRNNWTAITRRVGAKSGRILVTTTLDGFNWLYSEFYEKWLAGDPSYFVISFPSTENPTYPIEEYERARRELPDHEFEQFYNGKFARATGLIFGEIADCLVDASEVPQHGTLYGATDFGFNDPWATLVGLLDDDDILWLVEEVYLRRHTADEYAKYFRPDILYFADPSRPDTIKRLRRNYNVNIRPIKRARESIEYGIELVYARIKSGRLKVVKGVIKALLQECEAYRRPDKDSETTGDKGTLGADHQCDCLRYLSQGIARISGT